MNTSLFELSVQFQNLNQSVFKPYLSTINQPTMIEHINHVETPGIFGTHMEILAMATYYGVLVFYCCLQGHSQQQYRWHFVRPISSKDNHLRYPELAGSPLEHVQHTLNCLTCTIRTTIASCHSQENCAMTYLNSITKKCT